MAQRIVKHVLKALGGPLRETDVKGRRGILLFETRPHPQLPALIRQCRRYLPTWGVTLIHGPETLTVLRGEDDILGEIKRGHIKVHRVPFSTLGSLEDYNVLFTDSSFYRRLPYEHFLVAQTDSMLCMGAVKNMEAFLDYDYVGAPWSWGTEAGKGIHGGNGGFSLRRRQALMEYCDRVPRPARMNEDVYFCLRTVESPLNTPPPEVASTFAVESVLTHGPVGTHKPWLYLGDTSLKDLSCSCPGLGHLMKNNGPVAAKSAEALVEVTSGVPSRRLAEDEAGGTKEDADLRNFSTARGGACAAPLMKGGQRSALAAKLSFSSGGRASGVPKKSYFRDGE